MCSATVDHTHPHRDEDEHEQLPSMLRMMTLENRSKSVLKCKISSASACVSVTISLVSRDHIIGSTDNHTSERAEMIAQNYL